MRRVCHDDETPYKAVPALSVSSIDRSSEPDDAPSYYIVPREGGPSAGVELYHSDFGVGSLQRINGVRTYVRGRKLADLVHSREFVEYSVVRGSAITLKVIPTDEMFIKWWADAGKWYLLKKSHSLLPAGSSQVKAAFLGKRKGGTLEQWTIPLGLEDAELVVTYRKKIRRTEGGEAS